MKNRFVCFLPLVLCLFLTPSGTGEVLPQYPSEESVWGNPYPGLGNVSPGSANSLASLPTPVLLYAEKPEYDALSSTERSTELYLSNYPCGQRTGLFQKINFNALWVPDSGSQGLGMTELDLSATFAVPMLTRDSPLLLTPKFSTTSFYNDGWDKTFYMTGMSVRWIRPIVKNKFTADIGFSALYCGDFNASASESLRFPAHVAGIWNFNPRTKIIFGVVYSDRRDNFNIFPMAGLIWTPNDDLSVELTFPRLRVAQRVRWFGSAAGDEQSDWLYTAFEFGSGSWGRKIGNYYDGRFEYRDLRLLLGYERRTRFGVTLGLEIGCMFDRTIETEYGKVYPSDSVFLRLRTSF